ncbi:MAG: molybdopterin-binding protein, partial [Bilophila sp.]
MRPQYCRSAVLAVSDCKQGVSMNAEIISVGTELLLGHTINTDATFVARELSAIGIDLLYACTVGDNAARLQSALETAL